MPPMSPNNAALAARDLAVVWHPCTQMHDHAAGVPMLPIVRGEGAWLIDADGRRYLDCISSWWTNLFGHANPRIARAVAEQAALLEHVIFAGCTHEPAIELAERLVHLAPRSNHQHVAANSLPSLAREGARLKGHGNIPSPAKQRKVPTAEGGAPQAPADRERTEGAGATTPASDAQHPNGAPTLTRVFFADNGSAAVEVALKMSFHFWLNQGHGERTRFIALTGSYHGETLGALSVSDVALYRKTYAPLLLEPILVRSPDAWLAEPGENAAAVAARRLGELRATLEAHAHETCAVIVEPLVQCAGGMRMYHPDYLAGLRQLCDEFAVHFIADEIAVGFGRTGTLFACEQAGVAPDFLCLSKGLTGGTLPLSVVLTREQIYAAFYAEHAAGKAFLHSHSYTGNPLACRAALATLAIFRDEPVIERNRKLAAHLAAKLAPLADHPNVADVRQTGMIAAVELVRNKATRTPFPTSERRGLRVYLQGLEHGALLRPLGDVVYFMPPYVVTPDEIDFMVDTAIAGIARAVAD
ncbi:MAG: adenosylmethionine--8-amino-7-oxononanoate transaminase [Rhodanobacteraceae bacterium]